MRILITGATGFIGTNLLPYLIKYNVKIVVRKYSDKINRDIQILIDENLDEFRCALELFAPEIVIHLAANMFKGDDVSSIREIINSNIVFTSILLEVLKGVDVKFFINTGTFAEYYLNDGRLNPAYFYAASKSATRHIIKYFKNMIGFKAITVIPYTVYGGQSKEKKVIDYIISSLDSIIPIEMTKGEQVLDFIHIDDITDFYLYCIDNYEELADEAEYHLGTGIGTSIRDLAKLIENKTNRTANILWGKRPYRDLDIMKAIAPLESIKKIEWQPRISLEQGLSRLFLKKN
jgi:CDP-paratose synthetase